jgi:CRISPR system Cascade subunit CasD
MEVALLRFDAPLMSFGSVVVDNFNRTDLYPYRAMLVGLIANALGLQRAEVDAHESLQRRLRYAARRDRSGEVIQDFHTVDLSEDGSLGPGLGWTAEGMLEERKGGGAGEGTHIRYRFYVADAVITLAFSLEPARSPNEPDLAAVLNALRHPARPLFLGRKCCLPAAPLVLGTTTADTLRTALEHVPRIGPRGDKGKLPAIWPRSEEPRDDVPIFPRVEDRDWSSAIHVGRRLYVEGALEPKAPEVPS